MWFSCDEHFYNHNDVDTVLLIHLRDVTLQEGMVSQGGMNMCQWEACGKSSSSSVESRE